MLLPGRPHYIYYDSKLLAPGYSSTVAAQRAGYTGYDSIYVCRAALSASQLAALSGPIRPGAVGYAYI